jgi:hypothetical protein
MIFIRSAKSGRDHWAFDVMHAYDADLFVVLLESLSVRSGTTRGKP